MLKNEFISFDQSYKLKLLGFDEPCFTKWEKHVKSLKHNLAAILLTTYLDLELVNKEVCEITYGYRMKPVDEGKLLTFAGYRNSFKENLSGGEGMIAAPVWQQAFDFFRNKYNIIVHFDTLNGRFKPRYNFTGKSVLTRIREQEKKYYFPTYEQARNVALDELLKAAMDKFFTTNI